MMQTSRILLRPWRQPPASPVPLYFRGGEFCGLRKFVSWLLTKKASNRVAELNVCEKVNKLLPNWGCLQIGYEKSLTMTLCREYK